MTPPEEFQALVDTAGRLAAAGDRAGLRAIGAALAVHRRRFTPWPAQFKPTAQQVDALDAAFDRVFPVDRSAAGVLDAPWSTRARQQALAALIGHRWMDMDPPRDGLVRAAVDAGDVRLLRLLVVSPVGSVRRDSVVLLLQALDRLDALDPSTVECALLEDKFLGYPLLGIRLADRANLTAALDAATDSVTATVWAGFDELTWRLLQAGTDREELPKVFQPRGLRFVLHALAGTEDPDTTAHLGAARLSDVERAELAEHLAARPVEIRRQAFQLRLPAGDAAALLASLGLATAVPLFALTERMAAEGAAADRAAGHGGSDRPVVWDRAEILAAVDAAGADATRALLELVPHELIAAALGWNRAAVLKRVKNNALDGIAAFGMLPLADGESVLDRYLALREVARRGPKLGPNRRHSHAAAVRVAMAHCAQVAGFADASRLEWACEADLVESGPTRWEVDDYTLSLVLDGADPVLTVTRAGKPLKTVPAAVRSTVEYTEARARQETLRDQARRLRTGLVERLVATAGRLEPAELTRLLRLPAGAAMLPALLWLDDSGRIGLLDDVDGPVTAVHPVLLHQRGLLSHWQAEVVRRRLRQPVKQAFRELYLRTPAERAAGDVSRRFFGHLVTGKVAAQLLSGRGWTVHGEYDDAQASRPAGALTAALTADLHGFFGMSDVRLREVRFLAGRRAVPLAEVPPVVLSEVMRDLDLVVSVAATVPSHDWTPVSQSRAELLAALIGDLGLERVRVDGQHAVITGSRATYRVQLASGSIHLEPGGYLCVVPAGFAERPHDRLFLPFEDEDRATAVILSKVLLLAEDEKITDGSILSQIFSGVRAEAGRRDDGPVLP